MAFGKSFLAFCLLTFAPSTWALHVVIDPGHGGNDRGAHSRGVEEAHITLDIAQELFQILKSDANMRATMTRQEDVYVGLEERAQIADRVKGDLFLSIHANSSHDHSAQGKEIYFQNQLPPDEEALFLANLENQGLAVSEKVETHTNDVNAILEDLRRNHRIYLSGKLSEFLHTNWMAPSAKRRHPIRQAPFHVVSNVSIPSVLIEVGYLTHKKESKRLQSPEHRKKIARGLFLGLKEYKEFIDKKTLPHLN